MQEREKTNLDTCTNEGKRYFKLAYEKLYTINVSQIYHKPLTVEVPRQAFDPNTKVDPPDGSQRLW